MPPRKSTDSVAAAGDEPSSARGPKQRQSNGQLGVEDLGLPKTMITRLAKGVLPANTQISKDAIQAICKSATVFVNYLASSANDRAVLANKRTIQPKDVLDALPELEFEGFRSRCDAELEKYNATLTAKRNDYRKRVKEEKEGGPEDGEDAEGGSSLTDAEGNEVNGHSRDPDSAPATKKARTSLAGDSTINGATGDDNEDGDTIDGNEEEVVEEEDESDTDDAQDEEAEDGQNQEDEDEESEADRVEEPEDPLGYQDGPRKEEDDDEVSGSD